MLDVSFVAIDPQDDAILYALLLNRGLLRSGDGGATWTPATDGDLPRTLFSQVVIDPVSPANVYAFGLSGELFKSTDRGLSWARIGGNLQGITALAIDPHDSATQFAVVGGRVETSADG